MARGRMLNKSICRSRKFQELPSDTCRLLATWLISHLDKHGVYHGDPAIVKSYVFPRRSDVTVEDVDRYLDEMQAVGLIVRFNAKRDQWQWWPGFADNQVGLRADRETTNFPQPPDDTPEGWGEDAGSLPDDCRSDAGKMPAEEKLIEGKVIEDTKGAQAPREDPLPHNLDGWLAFVREGKGKQGGVTARLGRMLTELWPERYKGKDPPYSKVGGIARNVGGAARLAHLLWLSNAYRVTGDPLDYCMGIHKRGTNGKRNQGRSTAAGGSSSGDGDQHNTPTDDDMLRFQRAQARADLEAGKEDSPYYQYLPEDERP